MSASHQVFDEMMIGKRSRASLEKVSANDREPMRVKQSHKEVFYSLLVGAVAFAISYGFGYWMFADPNPEAGRIAGIIIASVVGILFFVFAWGYFGQRQKVA